MATFRRSGALLLLAAALLPAACRRGPAVEMTPWARMRTPQLSVPLGGGVAAVEVRSVREGWTERFEARADGERVALDLSGASPVPEDARAFYREAAASDAGDGTAFERAVRLCAWLGRRVAAASRGEEPEAPAAAPDAGEGGLALLAHLDAARGGNCQARANALYDLLRSFEIPARRVDLSLRLDSPYEAHAGVEVWDEALAKWAYLDPFFCLFYEIGGTPAGALEVRRAVASGETRSVEPVRAGEGIGVDAWSFRIPPLLYFRNVLVAAPDGRWAVYAPAGVDLVSNDDYVAVESDEPFLAPPARAVAAAARDARDGRGVVAQAVGGRLYVAVRRAGFDPGAYEVRASATPAFDAVASPAAYDLDDPVLCRPGELLANPSLGDADGDGAPDGWAVSGAPARAAYDGGGLVVEAGDAEVALEAEAASEAGRTLVATVALEVERGAARVEYRGRRGQFVVEVPEGPPARVSLPLVRARGGDRVAITVTPGSRCRVAGAGVRHARTFAELTR